MLFGNLRCRTVSSDTESPWYPKTTKEYDFVWLYGSTRCFYLLLKSYSEVMRILQEIHPKESYSDEFKEFVKSNQNKEVLCYITYGEDIFICGDDNVPFTVECFI